MIRIVSRYGLIFTLSIMVLFITNVADAYTFESGDYNIMLGLEGWSTNFTKDKDYYSDTEFVYGGIIGVRHQAFMLSYHFYNRTAFNDYHREAILKRDTVYFSFSYPRYCELSLGYIDGYQSKNKHTYLNDTIDYYGIVFGTDFDVPLREGVLFFSFGWDIGQVSARMKKYGYAYYQDTYLRETEETRSLFEYEVGLKYKDKNITFFAGWKNFSISEDKFEGFQLRILYFI
ncbi:hypothetical protein JXQ70_18935 [bacterium]|nr:hypothetical protein [bacterium]